MDEVDKLLATNFIREVYYPEWLANIIMVKKANGKWRMSVDFIDLNSACLKDSFPRPELTNLWTQQLDTSFLPLLTPSPDTTKFRR